MDYCVALFSSGGQQHYCPLLVGDLLCLWCFYLTKDATVWWNCLSWGHTLWTVHTSPRGTWIQRSGWKIKQCSASPESLRSTLTQLILYLQVSAPFTVTKCCFNFHSKSILCVCVCVGNSNLCAVHVGSVLRMGCSGVSVFLALINCYYTLTNNTETKLLILNRFTGSVQLNTLIFYWFKPVNAFHLCPCSFSGCHRDRLV